MFAKNTKGKGGGTVVCFNRTERPKDRRDGGERRQDDYTVLQYFDRRSGADRRQGASEEN
jgi:hypothetical protein